MQQNNTIYAKRELIKEIMYRLLLPSMKLSFITLIVLVSRRFRNQLNSNVKMTHCKSNRYLPLIFTSISIGFFYQSGIICDEYFKYPTTTFVSIVRGLPVT